MEYLIATYGYFVIAAGTFLEGETVLIVGAFLAHQHYLNLKLVMAAAFAGSFIGDQLYFFIGRSRTRLAANRLTGLQDRIKKFQVLLKKYDTVIILFFRFIYGLRTVAPFAIGMSDVPVLKFFILNLISAVLWSVCVGLLGYYFGHAVEIAIGEIKKIEILILMIIVLLMIIIVVKKIIRKSNIDKM